MMQILFWLLTLSPMDRAPMDMSQATEANCSISAWITDKDPNGLNVRDKPGVTGKVIAKLKRDSEDDEVLVNVVGYADGWLKISGATHLAGGEIFSDLGWVSAKMVETGTKGFPNYNHSAPLYAAAKASSPKVGSIPSESLVKIAGFTCGWVKVSHQGKTGWLRFNNICGSPVTTCS